jgi:hypothetical protein
VVTYVEGDAYINGKPAPRLGSVLSENAVLSTAKGRAEVLFGRGDKVFLDKDSSIRVNPNSRTDAAELEILAGSAVIHTGGLGPEISCAQGVQLSDAGIFRFDVHRVVGENFCRLRSTRELPPRKCRVSSGC